MNNKTKQKGGKEEYKVLKKVYKANWRDDVPEEAKAEAAAIDYEFYRGEKSYKSPERVSGDSVAGALERVKQSAIGQRIMAFSGDRRS